jgi:hypothetical protein
MDNMYLWIGLAVLVAVVAAIAIYYYEESPKIDGNMARIIVKKHHLMPLRIPAMPIGPPDHGKLMPLHKPGHVKPDPVYPVGGMNSCNLLFVNPPGYKGCPPPPPPLPFYGMDNLVDWMVGFLVLTEIYNPYALYVNNLNFVAFGQVYPDGDGTDPSFTMCQGTDDAGELTGGFELTSEISSPDSCKSLKGSTYDYNYSCCTFTSKTMSKEDLVSLLHTFFTCNDDLLKQDGWVIPSISYVGGPTIYCEWYCGLPVNWPLHGLYFRDVRKAIGLE